ncbi:MULTISPECIES: hypothetical protein [Deinococcus]|jgi:hypothetical protein|uniref:Uncharacterized protein n=1 Tax=Deinococcus radiodurans (strain ATCC 13939 / DSM 20539 / JCM 16871 / CCUG 27074 / LMG 4051 / NBRC 15346 / NCIMB 9279 / VKM B-1422 / R1) TaxID=243230 RepID=Q9RSM1_DEIRA|nr:hypothetical protein [Deinococcus radiodurans]AAF11654.1 hypothetical protein DR_2103 [Deinococcus radiodurans R1 = ATCC 13939 = DSM 20539]ANC70832.1 hypothetical protein A2G07_03095 [Deinococcus radiodurans R1 = ATCC 13939 = DSM 20539]QEM71491.1 hypothetical protein DXG80_06770 [Deinococcus radiodurans]QIP27814.1 hypothetical protein HAV23_00155 [Deinococcus radiodurans]QIP31305.1 hypothetical protein HAV35_03360 [Deinococcus radiodurans]
MTAPKELHERIDRLPPEAIKAIQELVERQEYAAQQIAALKAFAADWTPEEQAAWDEGTKRRPWRTFPPEEV